MEIERRKDYPQISGAIEEIRQNIAETKFNAVKIATLVEERNLTAIQWRSEVCKKFDKVFQWLERLPCDKRESRWESIQVQTKWLWIAVSFIMLVLSGLVLSLLFKIIK